MEQHFTWAISFGQIIITVPLIWAVMLLLRINGMMLRFRIEHETLMRDWAMRNNQKLEDLPTRQNKWW